jgi:hypothetical protein
VVKLCAVCAAATAARVDVTSNQQGSWPRGKPGKICDHAALTIQIIGLQSSKCRKYSSLKRHRSVCRARRRAFGRHRLRRPVRLGILIAQTDLPAEPRWRRREIFPVYRRGGARRSRRTGGLLGHRRNAGQRDRSQGEERCCGCFHGKYSCEGLARGGPQDGGLAGRVLDLDQDRQHAQPVAAILCPLRVHKRSFRNVKIPSTAWERLQPSVHSNARDFDSPGP